MDSKIDIGNNVSLVSSVDTIYEYEIWDDFTDLDNWTNSSIARYTVAGIMDVSNGHIGGISYGEDPTNWHGPAVYTNVSMTDFRLEITPKCQASPWEMGTLIISFYSGGAGSGILLWSFIWSDSWYTSDSNGKLTFWDQFNNRLWYIGKTTAVGSWDDLGDNMTLTRSGSTLKLYIDGFLEYTNNSQSTTLVESVVIQFCQNKNDRPICDDLRLDEFKLYYNKCFINIVYPDGLETLTGTISIKWNATYDVQESFFQYSISYSIDSGTTWILFALNVITTSFEWDTTTVTDGSSYLIKIVANSSEGIDYQDTSDLPFIIDNHPPVISLSEIDNNSVVKSSDLIELCITDSTLSGVWYNWDETTYQDVSNSSWPLYQLPVPPLEGYHWLHVYTNDTVGRQSIQHYQFYVNYPPFIEIQTPQNNTVIISTSNIEFNISDLSLTNIWYQWDLFENVSLTPPFIIPVLNSTGYHTLTINARDSYCYITVKKYTFYILGRAAIEIIKHAPSIAYNKGKFVYSFTITNPESILLNLRLQVIGSDDDILSWNNSIINLNPGDNQSIELEIRPQHASIHQLDIYLFYEDLLYYHGIIQFDVAPEWMSPYFLFQLLIIILILVFMITISGFSIYYVRKQYILHRLYWEQHAQIIRLIDQLTLSNLEISAIKETELNGLDEFSTRPLGFPQYLHKSESLNREILEEQFRLLKDKIVNGDPQNFAKLKKLIIQAEDLLKRNI